MPAHAPKYHLLQPAAFHIRPDTSWRERFYVLRFPETWKQPLLSLVPQRGDQEHRSLPIRILNSALIALIPDIITTAKHATVGENRPWLYSTTEVDTAALFLIISAWVRTLGAENPGPAERMLSSMRAEDLIWAPVTVDLTSLITGAREPGDLTGEQLFQLLPHVIAGQLTAPGVEHEHIMRNDPEELVQARSRFLRCPADDGAEVMSWTPHGLPGRPFSFFLGITVQTRPFSTEPMVHLTPGTRRWCHKPNPHLSYERGHTVYMLPSVPWIQGLNASRSFLTATIRARKTTGPGGESIHSAAWNPDLDQILAGLGCTDRMPQPGELRDKPARALDRPHDAVALVYRNGLYQFRHPVAPGASLAERVPLLEWAAGLLSEHLTLTAPSQRSDRVILPAVRTPAKPRDESDRRATQVAIAGVAGRVLGIDIFYDTILTRDYARRTLNDLLGIDVPERTPADGTPHTITADELTIHLTIRACGQLTADLRPDKQIKNQQDRLRKSVDDRASEISAAIEAVPYPTIALVEIPGKEHYQYARRPLDPKFAVKIGLGRVGRLTQCVTTVEPPLPPEDGSERKSDPGEEKLKKSWSDLIRQLGVRVQPLPAPSATSGITRAPSYLAIWVIRQSRQKHWGATRQVPVAVLVSPDGTRVQARAADVPWSPLHEAQLKISVAHMLSGQRRDAAEITRFCETVIRETAALYPDTVLLTDAHNLRSAWTYLSHGNLIADHLGFGSANRHISKYPGLRHIRIRRGIDYEVPDCYAFNDTEESSTYDGLWQGRDERTFLSTGDKPVSASRANRYASKITTFLNRKKDLKNPNPGAYVWNARPAEITVAAKQEEDDPEDWATLAHELRWATPHYDSATACPWPLRIAEKIGEYVLPVELLDEMTDLEEPGSQEEGDAA